MPVMVFCRIVDGRCREKELPVFQDTSYPFMLMCGRLNRLCCWLMKAVILRTQKVGLFQPKSTDTT